METAGITEEEHKLPDLTLNGSIAYMHDFFVEKRYDHVVCTVGVNTPGTITGGGWIGALDKQMRSNYLVPMILLGEWCRSWRDTEALQGQPPHHYVAISSNSARIARGGSGGYCASKAALSMGLRCAARQMAHLPFAIYGYEPGWLADTPMSKAVQMRLLSKGVDQLHRIPSKAPIYVADLARMIVNNIQIGGRALNGCMIPVDGGEQ